MTLGLGGKILGLHRDLSQAGLSHAFGGALALAYCTEEPRGTSDIDVNVFIGTDRVADLAAALGPEVEIGHGDAALLARDAQARLWWGDTPIDVFLSVHPFHDGARTRLRRVPFGDVDDLPVLACSDLAVFKVFFARPKDALDVATMAAAGTVDVDELRSVVASLMGSHADRAEFLAKVADTAAELGGH